MIICDRNFGMRRTSSLCTGCCTISRNTGFLLSTTCPSRKRWMWMKNTSGYATSDHSLQFSGSLRQVITRQRKPLTSGSVASLEKVGCVQSQRQPKVLWTAELYSHQRLWNSYLMLLEIKGQHNYLSTTEIAQDYIYKIQN